MKILVISDTHGDVSSLSKIVLSELPFDEMIFCGDGINDLGDTMIPRSFIVNAVTGNTDRARGIGDVSSLDFEVEEKRFFIAHGDMYQVKTTYEHIFQAGRARHSDIVIFGHTHNPFLSEIDIPLLLNPGSAHDGRYAVVLIEKGIIRPFLKTIV